MNTQHERRGTWIFLHVAGGWKLKVANGILAAFWKGLSGLGRQRGKSNSEFQLWIWRLEREREEVSSNATSSTEQAKDKLWKVICSTHMKFLLLWLLSSLKKHLQGFSNMFRYFCWHLMENIVVTLLFIFHLLLCSVAVSEASLALAATLLLSKKDNTLHYSREMSFLSLRNQMQWKFGFFWFILHLPFSIHLECLEKT